MTSMSEKDDVVSLSGSPILRHTERTKPFELAVGSEDGERLEQHIEKFVGEIDLVYHELLSDLVHVDVHHIKASATRPFHTIVTTGMSDKKMNAPEGGAEYAEVMLCLPASWPLSDEAFKDERNYWPIRILKYLARFPHEYDTWLDWGHTIPNGDPPERFNEHVGFTGTILSPPIMFPSEFMTAELRPDKLVKFLAVIPLYSEEMQLKLRDGAEALYDRFDKYKVSELIDPNRKNVAKKWWRF